MEQCQGNVYSRDIRTGFQCANPGKVERDGRFYCGHHDPVRIAEKRAKQEIKWKEGYVCKGQERLARAYVSVAKDLGMTVDHLKSLK